MKYQAAVQFRGETFIGVDHDSAIAKLANRFPRYRETSRRLEPLSRGWNSPDGVFMSLLEIARREVA